MRSTPDRSDGFSLLELMIVVTIISILATVAVPNFLEAQVRAKVSRTKADMRSLMLAVQTYQADNNAFPFRHNTQIAGLITLPPNPEIDKRLQQMSVLTSPLAYMTSLPADVFETHIPPPNNVLDYFDNFQVAWLINSRKVIGQATMVQPHEVGWLVASVGPDGYLGPLSDAFSGVTTPFLLRGTIYLPYDPTNGTVSSGNLYAGDDGGMDYAGTRLMERALRR